MEYKSEVRKQSDTSGGRTAVQTEGVLRNSLDKLYGLLGKKPYTTLLQ